MKSSDSISLGPGAEFDIVRRMLARWGSLAKGIGDDAVVLPGAPGRMVVSTDASVEDVHFRRDWMSHAEIGYRATAAALSDLAAMGAEPVGVLLALTLPERDVARVEEIADGIGDCVGSCGTVVLGGDVTRGEKLALAVTVLGTAQEPLLRSAARPGDRVYVTGRLGGASAALRELQAGREPAGKSRARFVRPVPRLRESRWLADHGCTAAIDISDGLVGDARHIAAASGVAVHLRQESVPVFDGATGRDAVAGGEEYELLVTCAGPLDVAAFEKRFGVPLTEIGGVAAGEPDAILTNDGTRVAAPAGYDHFSAS
ncbi:MAG TPA: thiamine-phosphate kinase [Gemmatimonadaceae bacterium]|nr:thiamine-phosphate kinase [Gemmatimonadaceae bacterium]